jgi:SAM-dependent methyltransferase
VTPGDNTRTTGDREAWLRELRLVDAEEESALASVFDTYWGEIRDEHRTFVERFCSMLPPDGRVLDAACGTGKYFGLVLAAGRSVLGFDHAQAYLDVAWTKFPQVPTDVGELQELPYMGEFDGVMCVDAMENVPPEEWPVVLEGFRRALRPGGWLYLTVELIPWEQIRAANAEARAAGLPVVEGEVMWREPPPAGDYYHYYPTLEQVRAWVAAAGFQIRDEAEGAWDEGYAYHHVLARAREHAERRSGSGSRDHARDPTRPARYITSKVS